MSRIRKWGKWTVYGVGGLIGLAIFVAILQAVGVVPTAEELDMTETAEALVEVSAQQTEGFAQVLIEGETATALASITPSLTPTPEPTSTPSITPEPSATPVPSVTPLPSATPTATATEGPETELRRLLDREVLGDVISVGFVSDLSEVYADWKMTDNFLGSDEEYTGREMLSVLCEFKESGLIDGYRVGLTAYIDVIDQFGNESTIPGMNTIYEWSTIEQINCANVDFLEAKNLAAQYIVHPLVD